jgi:hypothetical protein
MKCPICEQKVSEVRSAHAEAPADLTELSEKGCINRYYFHDREERKLYKYKLPKEGELFMNKTR